jgi:1-acyl-sn-glycerol-3-phosphate acyltransferase
MPFLRALIKVPAFALLCLLSYVVLALIDALGASAAFKARVKQWLYRLGSAVFGLRLTITGKLVEGAALVVANHCSYFDVLLLARAGEMYYTPKSDVKSWPLLGPLVSRFDVEYVDRAPGKTRQMQANLLAFLMQPR